MNIGAVIVTHNNQRSLSRCLKSLAAHGVKEIVLVDNHSSDQTLQSARGIASRILPQPVNRGFAAAANLGAQALRAEIIFFLNPDAALVQTDLKRALQYFTDDTRLAAVGLLLADRGGKPEAASFGSAPTLRQLWKRRFRPSRTPSLPARFEWVSAGAMLVRRQAFQAVGGFDPAFFLYWEDVDLCFRLRQRGWKILLDPGMRVEHQRGGSLSNLSQKTRLYDQSADRYFRKHYPARIWLTQRLLRRFYRLISPQVR